MVTAAQDGAEPVSGGQRGAEVCVLGRSGVPRPLGLQDGNLSLWDAPGLLRDSEV